MVALETRQVVRLDYECLGYLVQREGDRVRERQRETERNRERQRETERERERQTETQRDRQAEAEKHRDRETETKTEAQTEKEKEQEKEKKREREREREIKVHETPSSYICPLKRKLANLATSLDYTVVTMKPTDKTKSLHLSLLILN